MKPRTILSDADLRRVEEAIREAEVRTRGEIVVAVTRASGDYPGAAWTGACLAGLGALLLLVAAHTVTNLWGLGSPMWALLSAAGGAAVGYLVVGSSPALIRLLFPDEVMARQVDLAARAAFVDHEVFNTRDRSGVLIFVSLLEHRVEVLGDSGIEAHVEPGEWDRIVDGIVRGVREGRAGDAMVEAVRHCGEILDRRGLERRADDQDELSNRVRIDRGKEEKE